MKLISASIENYCRIQLLEIDAQGNHVLISGPNGSGKTSAVDAVWRALAGTSSKETPEPIHDGAKRAVVKLDLGDYLVERRWTPSGTTLQVWDKEGAKVQGAQKVLDSLFARLCLDPVQFLRLRPAEQIAAVLAVCGVEPPVEQVERLVGERIEALPGETADAYLQRLAGENVGLVYLRRREANRQAEQRRAEQTAAAKALADAGGPPGEPQANHGDILARLDQIDGTIAEAEEIRVHVANATVRLQSLQSELKAKDDLRTDLARQAEDLNRRLATIQEQTAALELETANLQGRITKGTEVVAALESDMEEAEHALAEAMSERQKLRADLEATAANNRALETRRHLAERLEAAKTASQAASQEALRTDEALKSLRDLRAGLLSGLDIGIPGLEVGEGELRLNGHSFRQASQSEQLRLAVAIAVRQQPKLRLLRIDDGECLDDTSRALVFDIATRHDLQVLMTRVQSRDGLVAEIVGQTESVTDRHAGS